MPFYAFTHFNEDNATYTGFRMVEADWELGDNETLVEADSLDGFWEAVPTLPKSPLQKRDELIAFMLQLPQEVRTAFLPISTLVYVALGGGDLESAIDVVDGVDVTGDANKEALKSAILAILNS